MTEPVTIIGVKKFHISATLLELWNYRELLVSLIEKEIRVRYKQTIIGGAWAVLQPLLTMLIFTAIFSRITQGIPGIPYPVFAYSGLVIWTLFTTNVNAASGSLIGSSNLITKVYFPRVLIPIAATIVGLIDYLVAYSLMILLLIWFHMPISLGVLVSFGIVVWIWLCATAIGIWLSAINLKYRDVKYAVPFFLQIGIFVTPIIYPLADTPKMHYLLLMNPMTGYVEAYRAILLGTPLNWQGLLISVMLTIFILIFGYRYFLKVERYASDYV